MCSLLLFRSALAGTEDVKNELNGSFLSIGRRRMASPIIRFSKSVLVLTQMCRMSNKYLDRAAGEGVTFRPRNFLLLDAVFLRATLNTRDGGNGSVRLALLRRKYLSVSELVLLLTVLAVAASGQTFTSLSGSVLDPSGAAVGSAQVSIVNEGTGATRSTTSAAYGTYEATKQLSFALAFDYGNDRANGGVDWWGTAGYARIQARPWLAGALRAEYYADPSGFMTGTPQRVGEVTTTLEVQRVTERLRLVARLEYRHDQSSAFVFDTAVPTVRQSQQDTLTLALLAAFRSSE